MRKKKRADKTSATPKPSTLTESRKKAFPITVGEPDMSNIRIINIVAIVLILLGLAILLTGGYFLIFGPETIWYNRFTGPTFHQYLQLYPGPICTLGFIVAGAGRLVSAIADKKRAGALNTVITEGLKSKGIHLDDLGDDYKLSIERKTVNQPVVANSTRQLEIDLVEQTGDSTPAAPEKA